MPHLIKYSYHRVHHFVHYSAWVWLVSVNCADKVPLKILNWPSYTNFGILLRITLKFMCQRQRKSFLQLKSRPVRRTANKLISYLTKSKSSDKFSSTEVFRKCFFFLNSVFAHIYSLFSFGGGEKTGIHFGANQKTILLIFQWKGGGEIKSI